MKFLYDEVVLQIVLPERLRHIKLSQPNYRYKIELEVIFDTPPNEFTKLINIEIPIDDARRVIKEIHNVDIPSRLDLYGADHLLETLKASTLEDSYKFYEKIK